MRNWSHFDIFFTLFLLVNAPPQQKQSCTPTEWYYITVIIENNDNEINYNKNVQEDEKTLMLHMLFASLKYKDNLSKHYQNW